MLLYIGIDPGASGGIAVLNPDGTVAFVSKLPDTDAATFEILTDAVNAGHPGDGVPRAVLERVWSSPQMGVSSAFKFGTSVGAWRMALAAAGIPYDEITPQKWQAAMGCRVGTSRASGAGGDKNITKRRAQALFPNVTKMTHAIADALLIAEFCRRMHSGAQLTPRASQGEQHGEEEQVEGRSQGRASEGAEEAAAEDTVRGRQGHRGNRTRRP